ASALNRCRFAGIQPRPSPAWASSQLEGGDAEHALETDGADRPGIHARGLKHWRKAVVLRERDRIAIDAGNVEKDFARAFSRDQRREGGRGAVVGHQRADLAAGPARAAHAPSGEAAVAHERAADVSARADPRAQERRARRRKHRRVIPVTVANGTSASGTI